MNISRYHAINMSVLRSTTQKDDQPTNLILFALLFSLTTLLTASFADSPSSPVPEGASVEKIAGEFRFTEGPIWYENRLLFTDIPANKIVEWTPEKKIHDFLKPSGHANGLAMNPEGRLLLAQHDGRVSRLTKQKKIEPIVESYDGKRLNSPNDLTVTKDGTIYFTDPPYGVDRKERELPFSGVYRIDPEGSLTLLTKSFSRPNGIVLSPNENTLYVNDSAKDHVRVFDLKDGSMTNGRIFARPDSDEKGTVDGMTVDSNGNLYTTGPGGVWIYSSGGKKLDRLKVPPRATNVAFGGPDRKTLYITAAQNVFRVKLNTVGRER